MSVSLRGGRDEARQKGSRRGHLGHRHEHTDVNDPPTDVGIS